MLQINVLDIIAGVVLLIFLVRGLLRGLTREVSSLVGIIGGLALARHFQPTVQASLGSFFADKNVTAVAAFLLIFLLTLIAVTLLGALLRKLMSLTLTLWVDHLFGAVGGLAKGVLLLTLLFVLAKGFLPNMPVLDEAKATPLFLSLADYLRAFLPDAFTSYKLPFHL